MQNQAMVILLKLQQENKLVLLECVKQIISSPSSQNRCKVLILQMLMDRIQEFPTLSLETFRRMLQSHISDETEDVDLRAQLMNFGGQIYKHKKLYSSEHQNVIEQLFGYMISVVENYTECQGLVLKYKAQLMRNILEQGKIDQLDFSQKKETRDPVPIKKTSIKSLITNSKPWQVQDNPELRE